MQQWYAVALILRRPVYELIETLPHAEFLGWQAFITQHPEIIPKTTVF